MFNIGEKELLMYACNAQEGINKTGTLTVRDIKNIGLKAIYVYPYFNIKNDEHMIKEWAKYYKWCDVHGNDITILSYADLRGYLNNVCHSRFIIDTFKEAAIQYKERGLCLKL